MSTQYTFLKHFVSYIDNPPEPQNPSTTSEVGDLDCNFFAIC